MYLGLPLSVKKLTKADWQQLLDKMDRHLATWKARLMSKAGRLEMLNSVLTSLAVYMMSINEMPPWVKKEFDKRRRAWLWAGEASCNGGKCRVNWKTVCRPKHLGGLGVHCIDSFGRALRLRWLWQKWKCPNKTWSHTHIPSTAKDRALFDAATKITIGNGQTANFWTDKWLYDLSPKEIAPELYKIAVRKNRTVCEALKDRKWLMDLRFSLDIHHSDELLRMEILLDGIRLTDTPDEISWTFGSKDYYTTKSAYVLQFIGAVNTDYKKIIWKSWAPARCKFFIWTLMLDRVLTADKLLLRRWENEYFCPLCRRNLETTTHLFTECPYSLKVWSAVATKLSHDEMKPNSWTNTYHNFQSWYRGLVGTLSKERRKTVVTLTNLVCWEIWKERNRRIFEKKEMPASAMIVKTLEEVDVWRMAGAPMPLVIQVGGTPFDPG
jgi:hypothetical protein